MVPVYGQEGSEAVIIRLILIASGVLLLIFSERMAPALDRLLGRAVPEIKTAVITEEEDGIVDNKTKWRVLIAGYILFALIAVFSLLSIFTLNNKINSLYTSVQRLESEAE